MVRSKFLPLSSTVGIWDVTSAKARELDFSGFEDRSRVHTNKSKGRHHNQFAKKHKMKKKKHMSHLDYKKDHES